MIKAFKLEDGRPAEDEIFSATSLIFCKVFCTSAAAMMKSSSSLVVGSNHGAVGVH